MNLGGQLFPPPGHTPGNTLHGSVGSTGGHVQYLPGGQGLKVYTPSLPALKMPCGQKVGRGDICVKQVQCGKLAFLQETVHFRGSLGILAL